MEVRQIEKASLSYVDAGLAGVVLLRAVAEVLAVPDLIKNAASRSEEPKAGVEQCGCATHLVIAARKRQLGVVEVVVLGEDELVGASPVHNTTTETAARRQRS